MTDQPEPEDTCRPVEIDGETIRVRGGAELTDEGREALSNLVQAAKAKLTAEAPAQVGELQNRLRLAHKARRAKVHQLDDIRNALCGIGFMNDDDPYSHADLADVIRQNELDIGEAEAWCKVCRRVWDGPRHRCESDAEQAIARVLDLHSRDSQGRCSYCTWLDDQAGSGLDVSHPCDTVRALDRPETAPGIAPTYPDAAARHALGALDDAGLLDRKDQQ
ncbi:hypothetical protein [Streptomyces sp. NPDC060188]|uniref:hypothetical protein n=1 Tax=Streptomyces sp. NPDC060188 TaxID=3347068 RepID=UPI003662B303